MKTLVVMSVIACWSLLALHLFGIYTNVPAVDRKVAIMVALLGLG
jgi:hypothetical protein